MAHIEDRLSGPALEAYETWRALGMSERTALVQLINDGLVQLSGFEQAVLTFESLGMSPQAARIAAKGRQTETEARALWESATRTPQDDLYARHEATLDRLEHMVAEASDETLDAVVANDPKLSEARRRGSQVRHPRTSTVRKPATSNVISVQEAGRWQWRDRGSP